MSFDRVLPNPLALCYDSPQRSIPRRTDTLLEHKIMTGRLSKIVTEYDCPKAISESKALEDALSHPAMTTSPVNLAKSAAVMASPVPTSTISRKRVVPLVTVGLDRTESSTSSNSSKESNVQFCLCQPDPKIPRPRNGPFILLLSLCSR